MRTALSLPLNHNEEPILFICGLPRSGTTFANVDDFASSGPTSLSGTIATNGS